MSTRDTFNAAERPHARRAATLEALAASPAAWFAGALAGLLVVFIGLAVDAYRHNHGAGEESLLSLSNPGHLLAAAGLLVASLSVLGGLSLTALRGAGSTEQLLRRFAPVTAAWVVLAAAGVGSVTYIGASGVTVGHSDHGDAAVVAGAQPHDDTGGDAGVAKAVKDAGVNLDDPDQVEGSLNNGVSNSGKHDHGKHPTFTQLDTMGDEELVSLFPGGTLSREDLPQLREQVRAAREVALRFPTVESANAAGYFNTTSDVPYMGQHFINRQYLTDGVFDPAKPEGLLFSKIDDGAPKLVGVWYLLIPGIGDTRRDVEPAGFTGSLDLWHAHVGLCLVGLAGASEGETREGCEAKGGNFTADLRWMMHVWVAPESTENPDGFFAYLNSDLWSKQAAVRGVDAQPSGTIP